MNKDKVRTLLVPYSPPLSPTQMDEICSKIAELSEAEIMEAVKKAKASKRTRKS